MGVALDSVVVGIDFDFAVICPTGPGMRDKRVFAAAVELMVAGKMNVIS